MELYGVRIPTVLDERNAARCSGCGQPIEGQPWRVSILDVVAPEVPVSPTRASAVNPGPFEFHADPSHVLMWMAEQGHYFCRRSGIREIMRPIWLSIEERRLGLCDGLHKDDHQFVDPAQMPGGAD